MVLLKAAYSAWAAFSFSGAPLAEPAALDDGCLAPIVLRERTDPRRMRGCRRLVGELGFLSRRHNGGCVGRGHTLQFAPSALASPGSCLAPPEAMRGRSSAPGGLPVNGRRAFRS